MYAHQVTKNSILINCQNQQKLKNRKINNYEIQTNACCFAAGAYGL